MSEEVELPGTFVRGKGFMNVRRSKYDLDMSEKYARLAFQSASRDQCAAHDVVEEIRRAPEIELRISMFARELNKLMMAATETRAAV